MLVCVNRECKLFYCHCLDSILVLTQNATQRVLCLYSGPCHLLTPENSFSSDGKLMYFTLKAMATSHFVNYRTVTCI